ncbi:MAG: DsbA family protein [Rhodoglobus sp.]
MTAVLAGIVLITVAFVAGAQSNTESNPQAAPSVTDGSGAKEKLDLARRIDGDPAALGAVDAPVVLIEYADYRCPFCGVLSRDILPTLVSEYVDAGLLRIEWRDFPIFGDSSVEAAIAAHAAGKQGMFWEFNTAVYDSAPETGHLEVDREKLLEYARLIGIPDIAQFEADLSDPALLEQVRLDATEAQQIGVSSVPSLLVNDVPIAGAQPLHVFRDAIDAQLALADQ